VAVVRKSVRARLGAVATSRRVLFFADGKSEVF
jgi:hypothetical protein